MGNCLPKKISIYVREPSLVPHRPVFEALQLSPEEVEQLYDMFCSFDNDRSGFVSTHELFATLAKDSTSFRDRVFAMFDEDGSGQIDFREFVLTLWNYCTLSKASLIVFAFDLYDSDGTGYLTMDEIELMLVDLYGDQATTHAQANKIRKDMHAIDFDTPFTMKFFRSFVRNHPAVLFPAFQMQLGLQEHILGVKFWEKCAKKRIRLANGRDVHVGALSEWNVRVGGGKTTMIHPSVSAAQIKDNNEHDSDYEEDEDGKLHPKEEVAKIILQASGTLHHRRVQRVLAKPMTLYNANDTTTSTSSHSQQPTKKERRVATDDLHSDAHSAPANPRSPTNAGSPRPISRGPSSASRSNSQLNSPLASPRPHSQAEAQVFEHFFTPKHLLPSVQQQFHSQQSHDHHPHPAHHPHHHHNPRDRQHDRHHEKGADKAADAAAPLNHSVSALSPRDRASTPNRAQSSLQPAEGRARSPLPSAGRASTAHQNSPRPQSSAVASPRPNSQANTPPVQQHHHHNQRQDSRAGHHRH